MNHKKEIIITIVGIAILVIAMAAATYAMFTFTGTGSKTHSITSGLITFAYTEGTNNLTITNAYPMADNDAIDSANYFQFTVAATSNAALDINYNIYFEPDATNTLSSEYVKMYLTSYANSQETSVVAPNTADSFVPLDQDYGYMLYSGTYTFTDQIDSLSTIYRLRMWVDSNYTGLDANGNVEAAKTYKIKVNVIGTN